MGTIISNNLALGELIKMVSEYRMGLSGLSELEGELLIETLKARALNELDFGQELSSGPVKLVKRVTGNVSIFFGKT